MKFPTCMTRGGPQRVARLAVLGLLSAAIAGAWLYAGSGSFSAESLQRMLQAHSILAPALFVVAHVVAAAAFIPCSSFTLLAGFLWPQPFGLLLSIAAALSASCVTFLLARHLWRVQMHSWLESGPLRHLFALSSRHGWTAVVFAHLNPVLPSSTLGYAFGLSAISFRTYALSALLAMLPLQIALVMLGSAVRQALLADVWIAAFASLAVALAAAGVWYLLKRGRLGAAAESGGDHDGST